MAKELIRRLQDSLRFEADLNSNVSADNLYVEKSDGSLKEAFDICNEKEFGYTCVKNLAEDEVSAGVYQYPIVLYDENDEKLSSSYSSVITDSKAPMFSTFDVSPKTVGDVNLTFALSVSDTAYSGCSGFSKVEFYADGSMFDSYNINDTGCTLNKDYKYPVSEFTDTSGNVTFYAKVYDNLGHSTKSKENVIFVDMSAPKITPGSLRVTDLDDETFDYVPNEPVSAKVVIGVEDEDVSNVVANLSALNNEYSNEVSGVCNEGECVFETQLDLDEAGSKSLGFELEDQIGNTYFQTISYDFAVDTDDPKVREIFTNYEDDKFFGKKTNITVRVDEEGSGFDNNNLYVDFSAIDSALSAKKADNCTNKGSYWDCEFYNIEFSGKEEKEVTIKVLDGSSEDDLGNQLQEKNLEHEMYLDTEKPRIKDFKITPIAGPKNMYGDLKINKPKTGDYISLELNVSDISSNLEAYADFSEVLKDGQKQMGQCQRQNDSFVCTWSQTSSVVVDGPRNNVEIPIELVDVTRNIQEENVKFDILGIQDEEVEKLWSIKEGYNDRKSPKNIDLETTSLIQHRMYFPMELEDPRYSDIVIDEIYNLECRNGSEHLDHSNLLGQGGITGKNEEFFIENVLKKQTDYSDFNVSCYFTVVSLYNRSNSQYISRPEIYGVNLSMTFAGAHLGGLDDNAKAKVKAIRDGWLIDQGWVGTIGKMLEYSEQTCFYINKVIGLMSDINMAWALITKGFEALPGGQAPAGAIDKSSGVISISSIGLIQNWLQPICNLATCAGVGKCDGGEEGAQDWSYMSWDGLCHWQRDVKNVLSGNVLFKYGFSKIGGENEYVQSQLGEKIRTMFDPKETILGSTITLCLPGVIYNLRKARQIECAYIDCMENSPDPTYSCEIGRSASWCKYFYGELLHLLPMQIIDYFGKMLTQILSNPYTIGAAAMQGACEVIPGASGHIFCRGYRWIQLMTSSVGNLVNTVINSKKEWEYDKDKDYCKEVLDEEEEQ